MRRGRGRRFEERAVDGLAPGAEGAAHRAAQIGLAPMPPAALLTAGAAERAGQPEVGHQAPCLGELVGRVGGEVALAQHLGGAVAHGDGRAAGGVAGLGRVVVAVGVERDAQLAHDRRRHQLQVVLVLPPRAKGAVVGVGVLRASQQGGAAGPVHGVTAFQPDGGERLPEGDRVAERYVEPRPAQQPREPDRDPVELDGFRHCAPSRSAPGRGGRARACAPGLRGTSGSCRG